MCGEEFTTKLQQLHEVWLPGHVVVEQSLQQRFEVHPSGSVIVFKHNSELLEEHFFDLEEEMGLAECEVSGCLRNNYRVN